MLNTQCSLNTSRQLISLFFIITLHVYEGAAQTAFVQPPYLIGLRRESVPVTRKGQVISFKTSYSGLIRVGRPAQDFRVVFDTGSGHVVLPAVECVSDACLVHKRYNMSASETAEPINMDGSVSLADELCDQADITFGTGKITGEFVREDVCLVHSGIQVNNDSASRYLPCANRLNVVMAIEMSEKPFKSFGFDGILGLGLDSLALTSAFSFFNSVSHGTSFGTAQFATFLTEGDNGEESEIAFGGYNADRVLEPLSWAPVAQPELGYWQVQIIAIRIDGVTLDVCGDGSCRGVIDTGTSHLGIPAAYREKFETSLTAQTGDTTDCRLAIAPVLEIEIASRNLTLQPQDYMRRLPQRQQTSMSSNPGLTLANTSKVDRNQSLVSSEKQLRQYCRPSLVSVNLPKPVGPNVFILGEPFLHRYYTVFDWKSQKIGLGLAANLRNKADVQGWRREGRSRSGIGRSVSAPALV